MRNPHHTQESLANASQEIPDYDIEQIILANLLFYITDQQNYGNPAKAHFSNENSLKNELKKGP